MTNMTDTLYDEAYGPIQSYELHAVMATEGIGFEAKISSVTKQVVEEELDCLCWCGRTIIKVSRKMLLEGKTGYCSACDPNWKPLPKPEPKPQYKRPSKTERNYYDATPAQYAYIAALFSEAQSLDCLSEKDVDYVESFLMNPDAKTYDASPVITLLKFRLGK